MNSSSSLHEVLIAARNRIAQKWTVGNIYKDGAVCALGGLYTAQYGEMDSDESTDTVMRALDREHPDLGQLARETVEKRTTIIDGNVCKRLVEKNPIAALFLFNDSQDEVGPVLEVFDEMICKTAGNV